MTSQRTTLAQAWADFERAILDPSNASQVQRNEMRRAWYAGASHMLTALTAGLDPDAEPTEADLAYVSSLALELADYAEKLFTGRA